MSYKRIVGLESLIRFKRNCRVECRCGRVSIYAPFEMSAWFSLHNWQTDLDSVRKRLKCSCGARDPQIGSTDEAPNATLVPVAAARQHRLNDRSEQYRDFVVKFGWRAPKKLKGGDLKLARVCWAFRHGGDVWASAEYARTYGGEPEERIVRSLCVPSWLQIQPGAWSDNDPQTQTNDEEDDLTELFGFENCHLLQLWWDEQPMEWREKMNGVDRASLFDPGEKIPAP